MLNEQLSLGSLEYLSNNFEVRSCHSCGSRFWAREEQNTCGDAPCAPYAFIGAPVLRKRELNDLREFYLSFFERRGHVRISPYPVIARWREDVLLVNASIYDFQPLVTSGKIPPPANPLAISQPCIRLKDIDTVGKSGRHLTNFEMMAHHAFNSPDLQIYWKNETVKYCDTLLHELGADPAAVTYKETPWAGGGNAGISLEVLAGGLELATLVFMDLERSKRGLEIKGEYYARMKNSIVDTGYGLERMVWAGNGVPTIYDAIMPDVVNYLMEAAGLEHSLEDPHYSEILAQNARLASLLDVNAYNLTALRKRVAKTIGIGVGELLSIVEPVEALYAIVDHSRCLVFMLGDGIVPSNVKAGYLARLVIRKVLRSLEELNAPISLEKVIAKQIRALDSFPKYAAKEDIIIDIIRNEAGRFASTVEKGKRKIANLAQRYRGQDFPVTEIIKLYDSHGVPPEVVREVATEMGARVKLPNDFYSLVAATHERIEIAEEPPVEAAQGLPVTQRLFYDEPENMSFEAHVVGLLNDGLILDRTLFYPGGGGQPEDTGYITAQSGTKVRVRLARLRGQAIIHEVEDITPFSVGDRVIGEIDAERRQSLARHHTATHILLASIRAELGDHIWQEGAQKGEHSSRLDVSHYKKVTDDERKEIEIRANKAIMADTEVEQKWMDRNEAERKYGFNLYQGGVPLGTMVRIVKVRTDDPDVTDVQACAGTHMTSTGKVGALLIKKTERIQDGIERFEFVAGLAAVENYEQLRARESKSSQTLRVPPEQVPATVSRIFEEWKQRGKENEELKKKLADIRMENEELKKKLADIKGIVPAVGATAQAMPVTVRIVEEMERGNDRIKILRWPKIDADMKGLLYTAHELRNDNAVVILGGVRAGQAHIVMTVRTDIAKEGLDAAIIVKEACNILGGNGGGRPERAQGGGPSADNINEAVIKANKLVREKLAEIGYK
jgi:alanyl-tRNA synthetase